MLSLNNTKFGDYQCQPPINQYLIWQIIAIHDSLKSGNISIGLNLKLNKVHRLKNPQINDTSVGSKKVAVLQNKKNSNLKDFFLK